MSDGGQFSSNRDTARSGGYSSASDNEGGDGGWSSARSWTSDNDYGSARELNSRGSASGNESVGDSGFHSSREMHDPRLNMPPANGAAGSPVMQMPLLHGYMLVDSHPSAATRWARPPFEEGRAYASRRRPRG